MKDPKKEIVFARVTKQEKDDLTDKSEAHGGISTVLRNLIARFNNGNIKFKEIK